MNIKSYKKYFKKYETAISLTLTTIVTIAGLYFFFIIFPSLDCGGASLLNESNNSECANDIQEALYLFRQNMDMRYKIVKDDYTFLFDGGQIQKEYYRDGIHYTAYFNINKRDGSCFLKFFKRGKSEAGHDETLLGNYGRHILKKCRCE